MPELERLDDVVGDQRRAEPGAEPEEEHPAALVAADRLHGCVVDDPRRLAERALVVEADPARPQVDRLGDQLAAAHRCGDADADDVPRPAVAMRSTPSTICFAVSFGPESKRRFSCSFEASTLTCEPPTSTASTVRSSDMAGETSGV